MFLAIWVVQAAVGLVAQRQDLDVFVGVAHRQEPEKPDHAGEGEVGQS
jgi:hypothetical protein